MSTFSILKKCSSLTISWVYGMHSSYSFPLSSVSPSHSYQSLYSLPVLLHIHDFCFGFMSYLVYPGPSGWLFTRSRYHYQKVTTSPLYQNLSGEELTLPGLLFHPCLAVISRHSTAIFIHRECIITIAMSCSVHCNVLSNAHCNSFLYFLWTPSSTVFTQP